MSSTLNTYQPDVQSPWKNRAQDFKALQTALQAGDLSGAQQAFATLQKDQPASSQAAQAANAPSQNSQGALTSGDVSGAQQAFAALKQDIQGAGRAGHHHHRHGASVDKDKQATSANSSTSSQNTSQGAQDFQTLQSALSSGDLSGAQQAFAALQKDLQATGQAGQHHHHHGGSVNGTTQAASSISSAAATQSVGGILNVQA